MNVKKLTVGAWINCAAAILSLISLIVYTMSVNNAGYFQNQSVANMLLYVVVAAALFAGAVIIAQLDKQGAAVSKIITGLMQIAAPVLIVIPVISLVASRAEGMVFILFSNPEVLKEVQTPENMTSVRLTIATIVILAVVMLFGWIAAFCDLKKKEA